MSVTRMNRELEMTAAALCWPYSGMECLEYRAEFKGSNERDPVMM